MRNTAVEFLIENFKETLQAALAQGKMHAYLPTTKPQGRVIVVGAGKAAASMAQALENEWPYPDVPLQGLVITRYGHGVATQSIEVVEASHPVPDEKGQVAAMRILEQVDGLTEDDWVIALMSGGASSLLSLPCDGISLVDKQAVNKALLKSGASIDKMNAVRKHLSAIKGGRLAQAAYPAQVLTLAISDVVGDDLSVIGSGPTVADSSTIADVLSIVSEYALALPDSVMAWLREDSHAIETPKTLANSQAVVMINPNQALLAAKAHAKQQGINVVYLGDQITGEAKEAAKVFAGMAKFYQQGLSRGSAPILLLSGGETTVTIPDSCQGKGGRNSEFLLSLLIELSGTQGIYALAADTDGIDGSEDNAGAWISPNSHAKAVDLGLNAKVFLAEHRAYDFFAAMSQLLVTGPTKTNINDYRAILIVAE